MPDALLVTAEHANVVSVVRRALVDDGIRVLLQPIIDLSTGHITSEELLIRIATGNGELLSPCAFIPVVEEHGLAGAVDRVMIDRAAALASSSRPVNVNLSAATCADGCFYDDVIAALDRNGGQAEHITIELTETAVASDMSQVSELARRLAARGFTIALDDFGSGWGSVKYLKALPVSVIKIGREFVRDVDWSPRARQVVSGLVALAHALDQEVVAEGVEQGYTLSTLRALGVDRAQGFYIGRPRPPAA